MKHKAFTALLLTVGLAGTGFSTSSNAGQFNPLVGNPFVFCSSPKPCKHCQPYRRIYGEICDSQKDANKATDPTDNETPEQLAARNKALTAAQLVAFKQEGAAAVTAAIQRGDTIILMEENTPDLSFNAYAAGWNTEWKRYSQ